MVHPRRGAAVADAETEVDAPRTGLTEGADVVVVRRAGHLLLLFAVMGVEFGLWVTLLAAVDPSRAIGARWTPAGWPVGVVPGVAFGAVMAVALTAVDVVRRRGTDPRASLWPRQVRRVVWEGTEEELELRVERALRGLSGRAASPSTVGGSRCWSAKTPVTLMTFGEVVEAEAERVRDDEQGQRWAVELRSRPRFRPTLVDGGTGVRHVTRLERELRADVEASA